MLKYRSFVSYFSTLLLYILMISLYFSLQHRYVSSQESDAIQMQLCVSSFHAEETLPTQEETVQEEPAPKQQKEEPSVAEEKKAEEQKEQINPEPIKEEKAVIKPKRQNPKPKVKVTTPKKVAQKSTIAQVSSKGARSSASQRDAFLAQVREKINRHKSYPRIAQRRGIQGSVKVRFTILRDGNVADISVDGTR
ncbi:MAG: hypothetical protein RLZZ428_213, partial [Pseudomonadota bacterium]